MEYLLKINQKVGRAQGFVQIKTRHELTVSETRWQVVLFFFQLLHLRNATILLTQYIGFV